MPDQFVVPQFIDIEDKIIGPISARQFVILLAVLLIDTLLFKFLSIPKFLLTGLPLLILGLTFAFVRINGQPFHYFILNIVQTLRKPRVRVWDKTVSNAEARMFIKTEEAPPTVATSSKPPMSSSRLAELSLVVNTGGVYNPEDYK